MTNYVNMTKCLLIGWISFKCTKVESSWSIMVSVYSSTYDTIIYKNIWSLINIAMQNLAPLLLTTSNVFA